MKILKCSDHIITLHGLSLTTNFYLTNPNQNLAVCYQFQHSDRIPIQIQPKKGMVMQKEKKTIKIRVKAVSRELAIQQGFQGSLIHLNAFMKSQYNKKMMEKLQMKDWNKVKSMSQSISLPIRISNQVWSIRSSIKQSHSLNQQNSREPLFQHVDKTYQNHSNSVSVKKLNHKLNRQLQNIFEMKSDKPKAYERKFQSSRNSQPQFLIKQKSFKSRVLRQESEQSSREYKSQDLYQGNRYQDRNYERHNKRHKIDDNQQRNLEIILLALLAGFFVALGSNFAKLF